MIPKGRVCDQVTSQMSPNSDESELLGEESPKSDLNCEQARSQNDLQDQISWGGGVGGRG